MFFGQEAAKEQLVAQDFVLVIEMFLLRKETVHNSSIAVLAHLDVAAIAEVQVIISLHALMYSIPTCHYDHIAHHK
jgi:hypothetical protein